ncbi:MAG TPA: glycosyltransferase, partial [Candidatus Acidoferrum sp.]|nr:glycosyltransferase [Candidatus Acidoferrum sp.]
DAPGDGGSDPAADATEPPAGLRVVIDVRPVQEPGNSPTTAVYLTELLGAYAADPLPGESFALLLQAGLDDPTSAPEFDGLDVIGRRFLPPTRLLRSGALTIDPFLLRGASVGIAWRADRGGASGAVYHTAIGAAPLASQLAVVVTLLDLAPWELVGRYQATATARFGHRLRTRILRDARAIIVTSEATGRTARRLLKVRRGRVHVVPLAARPAFNPSALDAAAAEIARLGLPHRYLVYPGRYDARQDLGTLLRALAAAAIGSRGDPATPWPPRMVLVGASPDDRAALARAAAREGIGELITYTPSLPPESLAAVVAGARAVVLPLLSEAAGLAAIEAVACGTPVIATNVGVLPEIVAGVGIVVEPRAADRLAAAIGAVWADDTVHGQLATAARARATGPRRTWADVARQTREVYAIAAGEGPGRT